MPDFGDPFRVLVARRLAAHDRLAVDAAELRQAAVAITLVADDDGRACFLLTRRQPRMREHAGQWALPGGRLDDGETVTEAALRELHEEVGIDRAEVLGLLDDYPTRSGYRLTPVVVWVDADTPIVANPAEVAAVHRVPLEELERADGPRFLDGIDDAKGPIIQVPIGDSLIHAPTGAVLHQFAEVVLHGRSTRVAHFDEPPFARR